jgi:tetratricopeptide repeat protein
MNFQNTLDNLKSNSKWQVLKTYLIEMKIKYPSEYFICTELSNAYHMLGMYKESEQASLEAMQLEPNDVLVIYNYAVALYSNEKFSEAIVQLNRILKRKINTIAYGVHGEGMKWAMSIKNDSLYLKAICQLNLGKLKEAYKLIVKHLAQRRRGVYSDFTKKQVTRKEQYIINELNNKVVK